MSFHFHGIRVLTKFLLRQIGSNNCNLKREFRTSFCRFAQQSNWGSNKKFRAVKLNFPLDMTDPKIEEVLAPLRANVKEQVTELSIL